MIFREVSTEKFTAIILLPLAETRIDKKFDTRIRASDASLWGGAFCSVEASPERLEAMLRSCDASG